MRVYADNAATTPLSARALEVMDRCLREVYGNPSSLHAVGQRAADALLEARRVVARCLGCVPAEVVFTSGGTEANNQALVSAALGARRAGKTHLVATAFEHHAVLNTLRRLEGQGFEVTLVPVGADGVLEVESVERALRPDTALVSVMYANNEVGTVQPLAQIGTLCRAHDVLFHTDAVQAAGHLPIDLHAQGVDLLSLSGHKFGGPKGAGALCARRGVVLTSLLVGGPQERGRRAGTENLPAIAAMAAALEESCAHMDEDARYVSALRDRLVRALGAVPHSRLNGDPVRRLPGNVSFTFEGVDSERLIMALDARGVCASAGSACGAGSPEASHVLLAMGLPQELAYSTVRLSLSPNNTAEEVDYLCAIVPQVVSELRRDSPAWREVSAGARDPLIP
ncbi:cysteine desulfurase family protein [Thermophilibacter immobilis]|jgi:cysteine desulfurase|uniref:cysteine desulfurase n=1 Tax=Thermophilibacter immobilis TaxID=2779519 RepID=A0A7S7RTP7_9ACTN|nr:cysteine desulfurase family protein [Thermophilibacter immobilis]QOY59805.1 cysteine desulfurase [Thermophilibacter immobilis]